jgi:hypothetical protein
MRGFSTAFPCGAAGIGLVLLRCSIVMELFGFDGTSSRPLWFWALLGFTAVLVAAGLVTPLAALGCLVDKLIGFGCGYDQNIGLLATSVLDMAAYGVLGPGAYSADARLFGRRRLFSDTDLQDGS